MRYGKHAAMVDSLYERLQRTNPRARVTKESEYYYPTSLWLAGVMDVRVSQKKGNKWYIDYWEVKSSNSNSCRHKAYKQAQHFYTAFKSPNAYMKGLEIVPRFVLVTPKGVTRISEDQAYHRSPEQ